MTKLTLAAALALSLSTGVALAQTAPAAPAMAAPAAKTTPMMKSEKPRTAQSLECSKKADAANIHGKPRAAYMRKCKEGKA